jgi:hypothetical protein
MQAFILGIDAPFEDRVKRILSFDRPDYPKTYEEAKKALERDLGVGEEAHGQQVKPSLALADIVIENSGTLADLKERVLEVVSQRLFPQEKI